MKFSTRRSFSRWMTLFLFCAAVQCQGITSLPATIEESSEQTRAEYRTMKARDLVQLQVRREHALELRRNEMRKNARGDIPREAMVSNPRPESKPVLNPPQIHPVNRSLNQFVAAVCIAFCLWLLWKEIVSPNFVEPWCFSGRRKLLSATGGSTDGHTATFRGAKAVGKAGKKSSGRSHRSASNPGFISRSDIVKVWVLD